MRNETVQFKAEFIGFKGQYAEWKAPMEFHGMRVTRALGRLCSGDTIMTSHEAKPVCNGLIYHSDGEAYIVVTQF